MRIRAVSFPQPGTSSILKQEQVGHTNEQAPHSMHWLPINSQTSGLMKPVVILFMTLDIHALFSLEFFSNIEIE